MSNIVKPLPYSVNLSKPLEKTDLHTLFVMGDNLAHRFELEILSGSEAVDLTSATVTGYFTNFKEDTTVTVTGKVEGGKAVVVLSKPCYTLHGQFVFAIQVKIGEVEDTVFLGEGFMRMTKGETIIYDDYIVYDVSALLAQISAMKTATENANKAAAAANEAAGHAPYVDEQTGFWMCWDAGAGKYVSTGVSATGPQGPAGSGGTGSGTVTGVKIGDASFAPDASGMVDMSGMTAPNADQLNGNSAEYYATAESVSRLSEQITEQKESISDSWTSGKTYAVRDYVIYGNRLYKCKIAHTAGNTFDATYWEAVSLSEELNAVDKKMFIVSKRSGGEGKVSINTKTTIGKRVLFFFGTANNFPCTGVVIANYEYEPAAYAMLRQFDFLEGADEFRILECSTDGNVVTINMPLYGTYNFMAMFDIE